MNLFVFRPNIALTFTLSVVYYLSLVSMSHDFDLSMFHSTVGNKNDCPSRKVVITEDAQRFASQMNIPLFETSAKENINVEEMFLTITKMVIIYSLV